MKAGMPNAEYVQWQAYHLRINQRHELARLMGQKRRRR